MNVNGQCWHTWEWRKVDGFGGSVRFRWVCTQCGHVKPTVTL